MTIQQIQNLLQYLGYYTITVDGIWVSGTEQATKDFQADARYYFDSLSAAQTRDRMTTSLSSDGLTVTLKSTETINILADQYYTLDNI